jgi:hypothetical protein
MSTSLLLPILAPFLLLVSLLRPILGLLMISPIIGILRLLLPRRSLTIIRARLREILRRGNPSLWGWLR